MARSVGSAAASFSIPEVTGPSSAHVGCGHKVVMQLAREAVNLEPARRPSWGNACEGPCGTGLQAKGAF